MNSITPRRWELKLGVVQTIALLGVIFGGLATTFYLGYSAGRTTGHEQALAASLAAAPKVSLRPEGASSEHVVSSRDIFAKLDTQAIETNTEETKQELKVDKDAVEVASIPVAEIPEEKITEKIKDAPAIEDLALEEEASPKIAPGKTLADLAATQPKVKTESDSLKAEVASIVKSDPLNKAPSPIEDSEIKPISESVAKMETKPNLEQQKSAIKKEEKVVKEEKITEAKIVEPKKETPKKIETEKVMEKPQNTISKGWFAQVAAPQELSDAQSVVSKLRSSGFKASIENATVRGESYYRVLVGPEEKKDQAERLVQQLQRESYLKGAPFLRFIK